MKSALVIGLGRFGTHLAEKLIELDYQVMAVDRDEQRVNDIISIVTDAQIGDSASRAFLETLGVDNYDICYVAIGDDFESSLVTTAYLKELGARKVVSRAASGVQRQFLLRNGADEVVYPEGQLAAWTAIRNTSERLLDYIALDENFAVYELAVPPEWDGKTVGELNIRRKYDLNLLAVREDGNTSAAVTGETALKENQTILVLAQWKDVQKFLKL